MKDENVVSARGRRWKIGARLTIASALALGVVSTVLAGPAGASGSLYPSGCATYDNGDAGWPNNCYIGYSYLTGASFITGVQRVAQGSGCSISGIDGYYGSSTQSAVKCLQGKEKVGVDGVVGTSTWSGIRPGTKFMTYAASSSCGDLWNGGSTSQVFRNYTCAPGGNIYQTKNVANTAFSGWGTDGPS